MRIETVDAASEAAALAICSWAAVAVEVESGHPETRAWMCFESISDYETWQRQA